MTALRGALALALCFLPGIAQALTVVDHTGRAVTLTAAPRRIVSLVPGVTEILFAIGAQDALVGVTDFCDYPAEARRKARVGDMLAPNLETLVSLRPDVVVATRSGNREETFDQLKRLGLPVYLVDEPPSIADVLQLVGGLGRLTGRRDAAAAVAAGLERRITAVRERVAGRPHPRVLYVLWPEPLIVPGREAIVSELIQLAGGQSLTAGDADAWPRYSLEAAVAKSPEVILLANHGAGTGAIAMDQWRGLTELPAVKAGRLRSVDGDLLHRYGPRVVDGLEQLARAIHPEAFP